ncbi:hypothetical protein [Streptomyces huiliensis]|uniref:hypothetical protein n=1 Tax=Streptomyces huiliensis TaxID=2876027 RepID=UPI001CC15D2E|nr:hypothetical protein [Streptomyces huiliensis]MBZ4324051.1 hypothetical protein [Streptomyces huiliensis]
MTNPNLGTGSTWRLLHQDEEIARLTVTETDMPWVFAEVQTFPGFEEFRPLFAGQERALEEGEWERADAHGDRIRGSLTLTPPDGSPVAEYMLRVYEDGTAGWRWYADQAAAVS